MRQRKALTRRLRQARPIPSPYFSVEGPQTLVFA